MRSLEKLCSGLSNTKFEAYGDLVSEGVIFLRRVEDAKCRDDLVRVLESG